MVESSRPRVYLIGCRWLGERFQFTPWGILSGLFWVPGGTAGIYALRNAGLALSQGTWSALKVMVGFVWGVFIFCESVQSRAHATLTIALIISGLWGMSYFSSPKQHNHSIEDHDRGSLAEPLLAGEQVNDSATERGQDGELSVEQDIQDPNRCCFKWKSIQLTRRQIGYLCAVFDGVWGGSILVPMHFARCGLRVRTMLLMLLPISLTLSFWQIQCRRTGICY